VILNDTVRICHLASGSSGNSLLIESGEGSLLVDAGLSNRQINLRMEKISSEISNVKGVLITHEHSDHTKGVEVLVKKSNIPIHINEKTYLALAKKLKKPIPEENLSFFTTGDEFNIGGFSVRTFPIPHDAEEAVGLVVSKGNIKIGIATDLGHSTHLIRERLKGVNVLVLESNHNVSQLMDGPYPWMLKQRIRGKEGHLSNEDALALLCYLAHDELEHVVFSHVSEVNNNVELIHKAFERWVPKKKKTFSFRVVGPDEMGTPYNINF